MQPIPALIGAVALLAAATVIGVLLRRRGPRVRALGAAQAEQLDAGLFGLDSLGDAATVVQFSTEYCSRCPGVRRMLTDLVETRRGVRFAHVDLTHDPALAQRFHVLHTPTLLLLDGRGVARTTLSGQISRAAASTAIDALTGGPA